MESASGAAIETWLVTGASGLVGRAIAARLVAAGRPVRVLVHERECDVPGVVAATGDVYDPDSLDRAVRGAAGVVHAAALLEGDESALQRVNAVGTGNLADAAARAGVRRFVTISTAAVYADGAFVDADEDHPVGSSGTYARSKLDAEERARRALGRRAVTLRLPPVFGPGRTRFLEELAAAVLHHELPRVEGGGARVDIVHAADVADVVLELVLGRGSSAVYNLAGKERPRVEELFTLVASLLGREPRFAPLSEATAERFDPFLLAFASVERSVDARRAIEELGHRPTREWRDSLRAAATDAR